MVKCLQHVAHLLLPQQVEEPAHEGDWDDELDGWQVYLIAQVSKGTKPHPSPHPRHNREGDIKESTPTTWVTHTGNFNRM